jgi:nucleoside-diphosphate-sugar epimerase
MEYAAYPHQLTKHVPSIPSVWLLDDSRIIAVKGYEDAPVVMTTVGDIAGVVRRAIEFEGEWPEVGGISGARVSPRELQRIVEKVKGRSPCHGQRRKQLCKFNPYLLLHGVIQGIPSKWTWLIQ